MASTLASVQNAARDDVDVVVIGAGAAGIAATRSLLAGGRLVALLGARDRISGRVWIEPWHGMRFDHDASFILAEQINPWTTIARRPGIARLQGADEQQPAVADPDQAVAAAHPRDAGWSPPTAVACRYG